MIPKHLIPHLRSRRPFTGTVQEIIYKRKKPIKLVLKNIQDEDGMFVLKTVEINYKDIYDQLKPMSKVSFTAFIQPYIAKSWDRNKHCYDETVTIKLLRLSKITLDD